MTATHNTLSLHLAESIKIGLDKAFPDHGLELAAIYKQIGETPNVEMGHFAFGCFPLAKTCKTAPNKISEALAPEIAGAKAVGPYLNFFVNNQQLGEHVLNPILKGDFFKRDLTLKKPKTMVEFSQPNTHKEMHVGHMRNLCLGDAIVRNMIYCGQVVVPTTYPGDMGTHVAKCLWYLKKHNKEEVPAKNKGAWLGTMYSKGNLLLEDQKGTEQESKNREELTHILKELHSGKGEYFDLWKETKEWSLDLMKGVYSWADVTFSRWFFESEEDASSLELAQKLHKEGLFIEDDGAIGIDLSEDKLGFCLYIKSDGTGLYATKDISLAKKKFEEFSIDRNIYVVDHRQARHFKQVFKTLEKMGFEQSKDCYHLPYEVVELPDGAMSSRKGNVVPLMELIQKMEQTIKDNYLNKYQDEWGQKDIDETAQIIAGGAIKYGMIRVDNNRKIVFDMNEWLKLDGETGPYLQYVHARICSLLDKLNFDENAPVDWDVLNKKSEILLALKLSRFNDIAVSCFDSLKTIHMCGYLYELGKLYNSFYADCPISTAETQELKMARAALSNCVKKVMAQGLSTLGIKAPNRM